MTLQEFEKARNEFLNTEVKVANSVGGLQLKRKFLEGANWAYVWIKKQEQLHSVQKNQETPCK